MDEKAVLDLLLAEWESLRQESAAALERRVNVITWGTATYAGLASVCGWLIGHGAESELLAFWLLCVGLPFQALSTATLWAGEAKRSDRAGRYMEAIEADVHALLTTTPAESTHLADWLAAPRRRPLPTLSWETFLRREIAGGAGISRTAQLELPYYGMAAQFLIAVAAPALAALTFGEAKWPQWHEVPKIVGVIAIAWLVLLYLWVRSSSSVEPASAS